MKVKRANKFSWTHLNASLHMTRINKKESQGECFICRLVGIHVCNIMHSLKGKKKTASVCVTLPHYHIKPGESLTAEENQHCGLLWCMCGGNKKKKQGQTKTDTVLMLRATSVCTCTTVGKIRN